MRPLSDQTQYRISSVKTYPRIQAVLAGYVGLTRWQFKKLSREQVNELWLAHLWMMRQFETPMIGKIVEL